VNRFRYKIAFVSDINQATTEKGNSNDMIIGFEEDDDVQGSEEKRIHKQ
jgi:hypothetical protein